MLHYVFHAVLILAVNILGNQRPWEAEEDLRYLKMAATFFSTLSPFDGNSRHIAFMVTMTTALERLARGVIERKEKEQRSAGNPDASAGKNEQSTSASLTSPHHAVTAPELSNLQGPINYAEHAVPKVANQGMGPQQSMPISSMPQGFMNGDTIFHAPDSLGGLSSTDYSIPEMWQVPLAADWEFAFEDPFLGESACYVPPYSDTSFLPMDFMPGHYG